MLNRTSFARAKTQQTNFNLVYLLTVDWKRNLLFLVFPPSRPLPFLVRQRGGGQSTPGTRATSHRLPLLREILPGYGTGATASPPGPPLSLLEAHR